MQCRMSEEELLMPKYDASNVQQVERNQQSVSKKIENSANGHALKL